MSISARDRTVSAFASSLAAIAMLSGAAMMAHAADGTWNGISGNWSDTTNPGGVWVGGIPANAADFTANFTGVNIVANQTITLDSNRTIGNITFTDSTTSDRDLTISGANILTLDRTDATKPTINVTQAGRILSIPSVIAGNDGLLKTGAGALRLNASNTFSGGIDLAAGTIEMQTATNDLTLLGVAGNTLTFTGNATLTTINADGVYDLPQNITVNGGVTGTIGGFFGESIDVTGVVAGSGTLVIQGGSAGFGVSLNNTANTFTGAIRIQSGDSARLSVRSLTDSANTIGLQSNTGQGGTFQYASGAIAPLVLNNRQFELITNGDSGTNFDRIPTIRSDAAGANTVTVNTNLLVTGTGTKRLSLRGGNTGDNTFAGIIPDAIGADVLHLFKQDGGKWILSGNNSYAGTTNIFAGTLSINSIGNVGGGASALGTPTSVANGTIHVGSGTTTGGTLIYTGTGDTTDRVINLAATTSGGATLNQSGTGLLKFTSNLTNAGTSLTKTLTLTGSTAGTGEFAGNLVNGAGGTLALTKTGTGTWVLSGANTYTGITTINASGGMLQFAKQASLYSNTPASWIKTNIIVNSGGTLGLNVGGAGEFTAGDVTTLLTNLGTAINNNGLRAGSTIAFDTTNALPTTFNVADNIGNSTGTGSGAIGLTKLGVNTLNLTGMSTYTGTTTINAGTLLVNGSLSAGGGDVNINNGGTLGGTGTINRHVNLNDGGTHAVGNSIGSQTVASEDWNGGGTVEVEFYDLNGAAGMDYDFLNVTGILDVLGDLNDPVVIKLVSLDVLGNMGDADFNANQDLNPVKIVQAGSLIGFSVDEFSLDTSMITNDLLGGSFAVSTDGQGGVFLSFVSAAVVPEPASLALWSLLGLGLVACGTFRRRCR